MRRILLVTAREYRRTVTLPGFWVVSLIVPVLLLLAPFAGSLGRSKTGGYVLIDKSGRYVAQIHRRLELDYQRQVLVQLLVYAGEWRVSGGATLPLQAPTQLGASTSDAAVAAFISAGGAPTVLQALKPRLMASAPPFKLPPRPLVEIPVPNGVDTSDPDRFRRLDRSSLSGIQQDHRRQRRIGRRGLYSRERRFRWPGPRLDQRPGGFVSGSGRQARSDRGPAPESPAQRRRGSSFCHSDRQPQRPRLDRSTRDADTRRPGLCPFHTANGPGVPAARLDDDHRLDDAPGAGRRAL